MSAYRMYFLISGQVQGGEDFEAADDVAAIRIAGVLYDTCSDVCDGLDLWQGKRQLHARQPHPVRPSSFAVFKLTTNSNVVGCCTGRSAGLAPTRTLPT